MVVIFHGFRVSHTLTFWTICSECTLNALVFHNNTLKDLIFLKSRICEVCNEITIDGISAGISNLNQRMQLFANAHSGKL